MATVGAAEGRAEAMSNGSSKGRIPKQLIIRTSDFPNNIMQFFRLVSEVKNAATGLVELVVAERFVHWVKLPNYPKEFPIPCFGTAQQHADTGAWLLPAICPLCKWAEAKDPRHSMSRFNTQQPNVQHQWNFKVQPCTPTRDGAGKIIGQVVNPKVHLFQITQAGLFRAIAAATKDPELAVDPPLTRRALKITKELAAGKEAKDVEYRAGFSNAILTNIPPVVDDLPTEEELEKPLTEAEFKEIIDRKPQAQGAATQQGQAAPAAGNQAGPVASTDTEF